MTTYQRKRLTTGTTRDYKKEREKMNKFEKFIEVLNSGKAEEVVGAAKRYPCAAVTVAGMIGAKQDRALKVFAQIYAEPGELEKTLLGTTKASEQISGQLGINDVAPASPEDKQKSRTNREAVQTAPAKNGKWKIAPASSDFDFDKAMTEVNDKNIQEIIGLNPLNDDQMMSIPGRPLYNLAVRVYGGTKDICCTKPATIEFLSGKMGIDPSAVNTTESKALNKASASEAPAEYKGEKNPLKLGKIARDRGLPFVKGMKKDKIIEMLLEDDAKGGTAKAAPAQKTAAKAKPMTEEELKKARALYTRLRKEFGLSKEEVEQKKPLAYYEKMIKEQEAAVAADDDDDWGDMDDSFSDADFDDL